MDSPVPVSLHFGIGFAERVVLGPGIEVVVGQVEQLKHFQANYRKD